MEIILRRGARFSGLVLQSLSTPSPNLSFVTLRCLSQCDVKLKSITDTNPRWNLTTRTNTFGPQINISKRLTNSYLCHRRNAYSTEVKESGKDGQVPPDPQKQTIFQKMKQMTKDYWHILIPVHLVTSIGWMTLFYTAAKNGVDIAAIIESMNLSERYLEILKGYNAGNWAIAYALYKLATPVRYTVTVGGTTMAIRYLSKAGYLKKKPQSTIPGTHSAEREQQRGGLVKTAFKNHQQTEPPKT